MFQNCWIELSFELTPRDVQRHYYDNINVFAWIHNYRLGFIKLLNINADKYKFKQGFN